MTKAEELALKVYPKMSRITEPRGDLVGDANEEKREGYIKGYQQAEKDLALTWEDIKVINNTIAQLVVERLKEKNEVPVDKEFYTEVLKRFNEHKKLKE